MQLIGTKFRGGQAHYFCMCLRTWAVNIGLKNNTQKWHKQLPDDTKTGCKCLLPVPIVAFVKTARRFSGSTVESHSKRKVSMIYSDGQL